ncbi:hypothetical protein P153DRAFT_283581 [Dothidotthia symphoricarpi CBS 119687]|uniref:HCP-like protein n=1 Tax=Dothidotthia symphoricarpi CBS 119687 TaxID=1392245 RepID=A0A6A6AKU3_9PLEO|nr:uncharacterized protein P153DRAFT_283581 [Dothidotthia symphoricarpi CBS 119687]KAF2132582.1 hypothetical protein P153DRAFT_283581 [Dothidotthia symphoricarpi CBS 119687]
MPNFSHLLKKKDKIRDEGAVPTSPRGATLAPPAPEFTFLRTTTSTQEAIEPPSFPGDPTREAPPLLSPEPQGVFGRFRRHSNASTHSHSGADDGKQKKAERIHFGRTRSSTSVNVPDNLPEVGGDGVARTLEDEEKWEKRATALVTGGALNQGTSAPPTPGLEITNPMSTAGRRPSSSAPADEENIQEAIRLHEKGNLEASTALFGRLADPNGANNALAQVLYGLALRHAWGCEPHQEQAVHYLSLAASNSAEVEKLALGAGMKKGGAAKGELVLAMYELANCFRNGWGIKKDPAAAKQYYETAANLGDTDAMNEVAWCYLEGFGTKKDKVRQPCTFFLAFLLLSTFFSHVRVRLLMRDAYASQFKAAQFLRLAESKGNKTLGNTW